MLLYRRCDYLTFESAPTTDKLAASSRSRNAGCSFPTENHSDASRTQRQTTRCTVEPPHVQRTQIPVQRHKNIWGRGKDVCNLAGVCTGSILLTQIATRFVAVPVSTLTHQLESDSTTLNKEISELEKKLHYQEMTYKNSRQHIEKILQSGSRP